MPPRRGKKGMRVDRGEELTVLVIEQGLPLLTRYQTFTWRDGKRYEFIRHIFGRSVLVRKLENQR